MFVAGVVTKMNGFSSVFTLSEKNSKLAWDPSSRPSAGRFYGQTQYKQRHGCLKLYEHSEIHT